ncbi:short chain dehydrogenase [Triangularia verruculosa]|uniref:Short chain dehydrogenase n=1 Tax=Triangularia verruculosa TaxID=2587418 RepID=A0AAN7ARI2_9PEZI|nr:short chain dehydrogenase [Triangularia verruculosa]
MSRYDITPEKQASLPRYLFKQATFKPTPVQDVDLTGQTAIITGANSGVGFGISRQLLDLGLSRLILAVRDETKGAAAADKLSLKTDGSKRQSATIEIWKLDLFHYESVMAFAKRAEETLDRLDIIMLNAAMGVPAQRAFHPQTKHDEILQVNYLSTSLLAILLLPVVKKTRANQPAPTRITFTSSEASAWTKYPLGMHTPIFETFDRPDKKVDLADRMFTSKLLGQFLLRELARRVPTGAAIINGASPGMVNDSEFDRDFKKTSIGAIMQRIKPWMGSTSAVAAHMVTHAAVACGEETHGDFLSFQKLVPMAPIIYTSEGERISAQLWKETMEELEFAKVEDIMNSLNTSTTTN